MTHPSTMSFEPERLESKIEAALANMTGLGSAKKKKVRALFCCADAATCQPPRS